MNDLARAWIFEYLERVTSQMECELYEVQRKSLQSCDALDIIDYIELLYRYRQAISMQQDIVQIMAFSRGKDL